MLIRRVFGGNPDKYFKRYLPTEPLGELINICIRLQPLDERRMEKLLIKMYGPSMSRVYKAMESIPNITILKNLGTSNISLIGNAVRKIAKSHSKFSIAIDRIDIEEGHGGKRNCKHQWVTYSPEAMAIHGKLIQVLGDVPWLSTDKSRYKVSDITPPTKLIINKQPKEMPRHIVDHFREQFLLHHRDQMYPVTAVGLCLMKMQNVTVHRGNRIRISDLKQSDITYEEFPFRDITSGSDDTVPVSDQWEEAEL